MSIALLTLGALISAVAAAMSGRNRSNTTGRWQETFLLTLSGILAFFLARTLYVGQDSWAMPCLAAAMVSAVPYFSLVGKFGRGRDMPEDLVNDEVIEGRRLE